MVVTGVCQVCGVEVLSIEFGPHVEEHKQRGEFPQPLQQDAPAGFRL